MEILQFLLSFFLKEYGWDKFIPILNLLKENNFDLKQVFSHLSPDKITPIIKSFLNFQQKNNSPENSSGEFSGLNPISSFADEHIIFSLNNFFSS